MTFDITLAFDKEEYLNPQAYMFFDSLRGNIPEDTRVHILTNRDMDDPLLNYINELDITTYIHIKDYKDDLKSRCRYMFHCFEIDTLADWVIKMELDMIVLRHLSVFNDILDDKLDCVLEPENRKIFDDKTANRLWRNIYRAMGIKSPNFTIQFRENNERGLPLFGTGIICVKSKHLDTINERWIPLTKKCEPWLEYNTHPNEQAFTGIVLDEGWKWKIYDDIYKYNPIGHFRKGKFPSTELIDNCKLPDDTVIFDYHRPQWLMHVAKYNKNVGDIICSNSEHIPDEWWNYTNKDFMETK